MAYGDRESVRRVRAAVEERGLFPEFVELDQTARSAADAAAALGCRVEQIVKSLVFKGADTGGPVLVLASGPNRVGERRISDHLGEPVEKADAAFVREKTGFAIGGVPPLAHAETPVAFFDEDLLEQDEVWAAAGHTHVVFGLDPDDLQNITGARVVRVKP
ncbi:YbaK/EbsC family protein [Rubrobacter tropicus]|uniref:YbaK/EbsC family protein n=1 Tax=Rubrobacter tropicus TaxID=2653851 RepID=A0A6G8QAU5_9ACTN|nr:YbaK/EbsC family protein [Rubrobacter tropicus]QIN83596.1 YbaK/EbsC family protein [Rubrobacter tropicus]